LPHFNNFAGYAPKLAVANADLQSAFLGSGFVIQPYDDYSSETGLTISEASLYSLIDTIKEMGAPVEFRIRYHSYIYSDEVNFICGFFLKELSYIEVQEINGGFQNLACLVYFNINGFLILRI
jgi:hypothetical protein